MTSESEDISLTTRNDKETNDKDILKWGIACTSIWVLLMAVLVIVKFEDSLSLDLNEIGDFLAGAIGPVAIFWLILGFIQQGRELQLNTSALQLQAKELKMSVEQQKLMAREAKAANEILKDQIDRQEIRQALSLMPMFTVQHIEGYNHDGGKYLDMNIINGGGEITFIGAILGENEQQPINDVSGDDPTWRKGTIKKLRTKLPENGALAMYIRWENVETKKGFSWFEGDYIDDSASMRFIKSELGDDPRLIR